MLSKEEIRCLLKDAAFDRDEYWVTSGAAMVLYGIKELTPDIDLGCTAPMADRPDRPAAEHARDLEMRKKPIWN